MSNYPDNFDGAACDEVNGEYEREYPTAIEVSEIALQYATKVASDFETWLEAHAPKDGHYGLFGARRPELSAMRLLAELIQETFSFSFSFSFLYLFSLSSLSLPFFLL